MAMATVGIGGGSSPPGHVLPGYPLHHLLFLDSPRFIPNKHCYYDLVVADRE